MKTVIITGANRGLGLGLTKCFLSDGYRVVATCRDPEKSSDLKRLSADFKDRLLILPLDVGSDKDAAAFSERLKGIDSVDVLVNNAGLLLEAELPVGKLSIDAIRQTFEVNTLGPVRLTSALLPLLSKAKEPKIFHMSSKMGSIADNEAGGYYAYRMSKTALNMFNRSLAKELKNVTCVVLHPGWVQTDMGGKNAPTSIDQSVLGLFQVMKQATLKDTGKFLEFTGKELPW